MSIVEEHTHWVWLVDVMGVEGDVPEDAMKANTNVRRVLDRTRPNEQ
jgi:hypothetical protein